MLTNPTAENEITLAKRS